MEEQPSAAPPPTPTPEEKKKKKWLPLVMIVVVALLLAAAAGVILYSAPAQQLDRVEVTPSTKTLALKEGQQFTAKAIDQTGAEITTATIEWSVSPTDGVSLSAAKGATIALKPWKGTTYTLTATATHAGVSKSGTATITISPYADELQMSVPSSVVSVTQFNVTVSVRDQNGAAFSGYTGTVAFTSTISGTGTVLPSPYTFSGSEASHVFPVIIGRPGSATVTVTDALNSTLTASATTTVQNQAPKADFTFVAIGDSVDVDASKSSDVDGTIVSYAWNFGDGNAGSGQVASHTYASSGTYDVTLTVTDDIGATGQKLKTLSVNVPPVPDFTYDVLGLDVTVNASASSDVDGRITFYRWDWGDGSPFSSGVTATHSYANPGTYAITLTVTDDFGATNSTSQNVTVGAPPEARFKIFVGLTALELIVNASYSTDRDGVVVSYSVDWGDGNFTGDVSPSAEANHTYLLGGNYTITVTVFDNDGLSSSRATVRCVGVLCPSSEPHADFEYSPKPAIANEPIYFDGSSSYDLNPNRAIVEYYWEFGDGSNATTNETTPVVSHVYSAYGTYQVKLTVTNDVNLTDTKSLNITVLSRPVAFFTYTPTSPPVGETVQFDASGSSDADGSIVNYTWDWGDGSPFAYGVTASHAYAQEIDYTVTLFVTDNDGLIGRLEKVVSLGERIDYTYYDFFVEPWREFWDMRTFDYGDKPIGAECFNATAITDGYCTPSDPTMPDVAGYPFTNWYPSAAGVPKESDPLIYAPYRFNVTARNISGYDIGKPVFIPNCNDLAWTSRTPGLAGDWGDWNCPPDLPASGGYAEFDIYMQYMDVAREIDVAYISDDCPDLVAQNDGFIIESNFTIRMDYTASQRLFGVAGDPATWWAAKTKPGCGSATKQDNTKSGDLEKAYNWWFLILGNIPYDVFSSFEYPYQSFFTDIKWNVTKVGGTNITTIYVHHAAWGTEVLLSRLFYYGRTNYTEALTTGKEPQGWWGMELAWFEDFSMSGNLTENSMNFTLSSVMQYHFQEGADPGGDGVYKTIDDQPTWIWNPILTDYIYGTGAHPYSEMDPYQGLEYLHTTPGSQRYGQNYLYDYVPLIWKLKARETITLYLPSAVVAFHDPYNSTSELSQPAGLPIGLVQQNTTMTFDRSIPSSGVGSWNAITRTLTVVGPTSFPNPPMTGAYPLESRPIYVFRRA